MTLRAMILSLLVIPASVAQTQAPPAVPAPAEKPLVSKSWQDFREKFEFKLWTVTKSAQRVTSLTGVSPRLAQEPDCGIAALLEAVAGEGAERKEFGPVTVRNFGGVQQCTAQQQLKSDNHTEPIANASVVVTVGPTAVYDISNNTVPVQSVAAPARLPASAGTVAESLLQQEVGDCCATDIVGPPPAETSLIRIGEKLFRVFRVTVRAVSRSGQIVALREYAIDATSTATDANAVIEQHDLIFNAHAKVRVFDPNPLSARHSCPTPTDIASATHELDITIADSVADAPFRLTGPNVTICDIVGPDTPSPKACAGSGDSAFPALFLFNPSEADFAACMAYFHIDRMQHYVGDELHFPVLVMPVEVDVHAADIDDTKIVAAYTDYPQGDGYLSFGQRTSLFVAEDGTVVAHEYGHVLLSRTTQGWYAIVRDARHPDSAAQLMAEGFADYWSYSTFSEQSRQAGRRVDCFGDWAQGHSCRRTAADKMVPGDFEDDEAPETNGGIWSSMLYDLLRALRFDRRKTDKIVLLGHISRAGRGIAPTMADVADGIVLADIQVFNGKDRAVACSVFTMHGLADLPCCTGKPCGETAAGALAQVRQALETVPASPPAHYCHCHP